MRRHLELTKRKLQPLQMVKAKAATFQCCDDHWFFECLQPVLNKLQLHDKSQCIFNVDESGFPLSGRPAHIICKRGTKSPQTVIGGSGRENITIQVCVSADGKLLPPYIIYTGKYLMATALHKWWSFRVSRRSIAEWLDDYLCICRLVQNLFIPSLS